MKASAPATTANIGPGFDCLGAALNVTLTIELGTGEVLPKRVVKAIRAFGSPSDEYTGTITSSIPRTRGLGSSAACVAAGLLLGCKLAGMDPDLGLLLRVGTPIEGHPDNLAPALFGGLVLVTPEGRPLRFKPTDAVRPVVLVPPFQLSTKEARKALVDHRLTPSQAAENVGWGSALFAMLTGTTAASRELLLECTQDNIHQEPRRELFGESASVMDRLRADGFAAAISGAGPSIVCLIPDGDDGPAPPSGWEVIDKGWSTQGATLL